MTPSGGLHAQTGQHAPGYSLQAENLGNYILDAVQDPTFGNRAAAVKRQYAI